MVSVLPTLRQLRFDVTDLDERWYNNQTDHRVIEVLQEMNSLVHLTIPFTIPSFAFRMLLRLPLLESFNVGQVKDLDPVDDELQEAVSIPPALHLKHVQLGSNSATTLASLHSTPLSSLGLHPSPFIPRVSIDRNHFRWAHTLRRLELVGCHMTFKLEQFLVPHARHGVSFAHLPSLHHFVLSIPAPEPLFLNYLSLSLKLLDLQSM